MARKLVVMISDKHRMALDLEAKRRRQSVSATIRELIDQMIVSRLTSPNTFWIDKEDGKEQTNSS